MIKIKCETKDLLDFSAITDFQGNLKARDDTDFEKIERSIKKHGFSFPFFIWKKGKINYCLDGHGRLGALQRLVAEGENIPPLPVVYVKCKDENEAKEILLKLNSQYGHMTAESVKEFLGDLQINIDDIALPDGCLDLQIDLDGERETVNDDDIPDIDMTEDAVSKAGEIYRLGDHVLMCGDSTKADDVEKLMEGIQADCVVTDPPYNVAYTGGMQIADGKIKSNGKKMIKNDKMDYTTFYEFLYEVFTNLKRNTKQKAGIYVFYAHSQSRAFLNSFYDAGLKQRSIIIWYKKGGGFGDFMAQYMTAYEPCLFGTVGENNPIIYGSNGETVKWNGAPDEKTIWEFEKEKKCDLHPTMKPVALFQRAIRNSSQKGDTILDLFGGSGTTIIAAAGLGRKARVMEADPHFCDIIRKRWTTWAKDNGFDPGSGALT